MPWACCTGEMQFPNRVATSFYCVILLAVFNKETHTQELKNHEPNSTESSNCLKKVQNRRFLFSLEYVTKKRKILLCQTKTEDNFLLQNSLFHHRSEISLVTLAYLWAFFIKIVMEIQFLQVLWGNQCSICTPGILLGHSSTKCHSRMECFTNSLTRSVRMEVSNLILPQFRLYHITSSKSQWVWLEWNFRFCK